MPLRAALLIGILLSSITAAPSLAQGSATRLLGVPAPGYADSAATADAPEAFTSAADSADWLRDRERAVSAPGQRLVVSIRERRFWYMNGPTVLRTGATAVGKGTRLAYGGAVWDFTTPKGIRRVLRKAANPVWIPPDWHYVELARDSSWTLLPLRHGPGVRLPDGGRLAVRGDRIIHVSPSGPTEVIPATEEIIFGDTLFMPPHGTVNR
ncbi:MAG: L,D-transpeptidase, partial [Gemmatimonadetes bacterium]|nr:L,D-transpeptidase [Gemmatimonadota bacterium]